VFNIPVLALAVLLLWQTPQRPAFRTEVNYVELDVSVLNRDGSRVRGLRPDDFEVLESGKPQQVSAFTEVNLPMPPAVAAGTPRRVTDSGVATNTGLADGRVYVLVMDYGTLTAEGTPRVRRLAGQFITDFLGPNDLAAVVNLGLASSATEFTANKARLLAALNVTGEFLGSAAELAKDATPVASGMGHDDESAETIAAYADMQASRMASLSINRLDMLGKIALFLRDMQGRRKSVIYMTQGLDPASSTANPGSGGLAQNAIAGAVKTLTETLQASGATVYAIDPRGMGAVDPFDGGGSATPLSRGFGPAYIGPMTFLRATSEDTGGFASIGYGDLTGPYRRIVEDNSSYYLLGYESDQKLDGQFHKIRVRIRGRDVEVRVRAEIEAPRAKDRLKPEDVALSNAWRGVDIKSLMARPLPAGDLGLRFRAAASAIGTKGDDAVVQLSVEVAGDSFTFAPGVTTFDDSIEVAFQAFDVEQTLKASKAESVKLTLRPETRDAVTSRGWRYVTEFTIPHGLYQLRIAAAEANGHRAGSVFLDVPVANTAKAPLSIAGLAVTSQAARLVPTAGSTPTVRAVSPSPMTVSRTFSASDTLTVLAGIIDTTAGDRIVAATAQLRRLDGAVALDVPMSLKTEELRAGAAPRVFTLPLTGIAPGDYDIVVRVTDAGKTVSRTIPVIVTR
jgi:VWFA-related protein